MRPLAFLVLCVAGCNAQDSAAVKTLMQTPIAPASDALFNAVVYTNGQLVAAPRTDADWQRLGDRVRELAAVAPRLKALAPRDSGDVWATESDAYAEATTQATAAITDRNVDGVLSAGGKLYETCAACHAAYMREEKKGNTAHALYSPSLYSPSFKT